HEAIEGCHLGREGVPGVLLLACLGTSDVSCVIFARRCDSPCSSSQIVCDYISLVFCAPIVIELLAALLPSHGCLPPGVMPLTPGPGSLLTPSSRSACGARLACTQRG